MLLGLAVKWMVACLSVLLIVMSARAAERSSETVQPPPQALAAGYGQLVFEEQFDSFSLSPEDDGNYTWFNNLWYMDPFLPEGRVRTENGVLTLTAQPEDQDGISITTLARNGKTGTLFNHGYFEARIRWSVDPNNWSAVWLFSSEHAKGTDDSHWCEIDVFEAFSPGVFVGTVHEWKNSDDRKNDNSWQPIGRSFIPGEWHTVGLLWLPKRLTWFLNGRPVMSAPSPEVCERQHLFLILGTGAHKPPSRQELAVDWVRVYR